MFRKENIMVMRKEPRIFVRTGFTDMRKQINGLSAMVRELRPALYAPFTPGYPFRHFCVTPNAGAYRSFHD
jgi:hypothetical protein